MKISVIFTVSSTDVTIDMLEQSLKTLFVATHSDTPVEVILVLNGSSNIRLLAKLEDWERTFKINSIINLFNIKLHVIHIPVSCAIARLQGLELAQGDWVVYLAAGQTLHKERFPTLEVYTRDFYPKADILFNGYIVYQNLEGRDHWADSQEYLPSIWRGIEFETVKQHASIANSIGIAHKRDLGFTFESELDFCRKMIIYKKNWAYCDILAGSSHVNQLIDNYKWPQ